MEDKLKFKKWQEVLGTVAEIGGPGATISFDNFGNQERRLRVTLTRPDGATCSVICSSQVSIGVRNKEISKQQLAEFKIIKHLVGEGYSYAGSTIALIVMPDDFIETYTIEEEMIVKKYYDRSKNINMTNWGNHKLNK